MCMFPASTHTTPQTVLIIACSGIPHSGNMYLTYQSLLSSVGILTQLERGLIVTQKTQKMNQTIFFFVQTYGREWKSSSILGLSMYSVNYIHSRKGRTPGGDPKIRTVRIIVEPVWTISFYPVSCFRPFRASSFTRTSSVPIIALSR